MRCLPFVLVLLLAAPSALAQLGETTFPNSGAAEAQAPFLRGVLLLHSFEYDDARDAFREAQALDPDFAMAYWGEAMTHNQPVWMRQDRQAALEALARFGPTPEARQQRAPTERERAYLRTLDVLFGEGDKRERDRAYADAVGDLAVAYPDDLDAAAFYALALLGTAHDGRDFTVYMRAAAVAEEVFAANPRHPGAAHYLIHAYDDPVHAPLGLRPARVYANLAPDASHALHMPTHIHVALGMWEEATALNARSYEAARAASDRRGEPLSGHGWHALWWQAYTELQRGRYGEAERLLALAEATRQQDGTATALYHTLAMRAAHIVETEDWSGPAARLALDPGGASPRAAVRDHFVTAWTALAQGDRIGAEDARMALWEALNAVGEGRHADAARVYALQLDALLALDAGRSGEALKHLAEATALEDTLPFDFGPPDPVKPSHELHGEVLLQLDRPAEAQAAFRQVLERYPRRAIALRSLAEAAGRAGDSEAAAAARAELGAVREHADAQGETARTQAP